MATPSTNAEREKLAQQVLRTHKERIGSIGTRFRIVSAVISSINHTTARVTITTVYALGKSDNKDIPNVEGLPTSVPGEAGNPGLVTP